MSSSKVSRSQSRETALQVLFCQFFTDQEMAGAVAAVEAIQTLEAFQNAERALQAHRDAADTAINTIEQLMKALHDAACHTGPARKVKPVEGGTMTTRLAVDATRGEAIEALRKAIASLEGSNLLFGDTGFCKRLLRTYDKHRQEIDSILERSLQGWTLRRLTAETSAALRLGITELLHFEDVPPKVIVNEYVELAHKYGDDETPKLINGVLDRVLRDHPRPEPEPAAEQNTDAGQQQTNS